VALCKGVLARERRRDIRTSEEEIPVSLDKQSTQPGYLLGRLFAVLENVQRAALGSQVNATIRDRFYGAASATPASIFPVLLRNTQNHLGKLRKERMGQAVNLEKDIREIVGGLPDQFPRSLKIEDQGRFAIGYYHQSQSYFTHRDAAESAYADESAEPTDIETEGADQ
jgi:CRISPR-associated protein Csd1